MTTATQNFEIDGRASYKAESAIVANRLVTYGTIDSDGNVTVKACTAITDVAIGVALETVAAEEMCPIQTRGVAKVTASAAISAGAQVMPTASGAGKCSTAAGATAKSCGVVENAPGGDGEVAQVRLAMPNVNGPANS